MKHIYIILVSIFSITSSISQEKLWDLQQCVDYALENNISILQAQNTVLSNDQDIIASKGNFLPSLSSNLNQSMSIGTVELYPGEFADRTFNSSSVGFNLSQSVFNGFRT
jgi:outer membrane protein